MYCPAFPLFLLRSDNLRPAALLPVSLRHRSAVSLRHALRLYNMRASVMFLHVRLGARRAGTGDGSCSGLVGSHHIVYNQNIADQLRVFEARSHVNDRNVLETNIDLTCTFSANRCIVYG